MQCWGQGCLALGLMPLPAPSRPGAMTVCVSSAEVQREGQGRLPTVFLEVHFSLFSPWPGGGHQRKGFCMTELAFLMGKRALFVICA